MKTLAAANAFLEKEYWPDNNTRFARPIGEFPNQHRPLTPYLDVAAILCHIEERVIANDYTFSFASRQFQIARQDIQPGMRRQRLHLEVRLDGDLHARYQGKYLTIARRGEWPTSRSGPPAQDSAARSQRRRQQLLDGRLL